jgi:hypothetical protein
MAVHIVFESKDLSFGGDAAEEDDTGSPGSGGASPYLRRGCPRRSRKAIDRITF